MKQILIYLTAISVFLSFGNNLQAQKKPLDHSVYDSWQSVRRVSVPYNGKYAIYNIAPQEGDGVLVLYNLQSNAEINIERGTNAVISEDGQHLIYHIAPFFEETRDAKIKKKKGADIPKDTIAVMNLKSMEVKKYPHVKSPGYGLDIRDYIAFLEDDKPTPKAEKGDTSSKKPVGKPDKDGGKPMIVLNLKTLVTDTIPFVDAFKFSDGGSSLAYYTKPSKKDSLAGVELHLYTPSTGKDVLVLKGDKKAKIGKPAFDEKGTKLAFYAQMDTTKEKSKYRDIYLYDIIAGGEARKIITDSIEGMQKGCMIVEGSGIDFSKDGQYLAFGVKEIQEEEDTTVAEFERVKLEVWRWDADYLPTYESINKKRLDDISYTTLYYFADGSKVIPIGDEIIPQIQIPEKMSGKHILAVSDKPYRIIQQWGDSPHMDVYKINVETGERELLKENIMIHGINASPTGAYYSWFDSSDKCWYLYETASGAVKNLTKDLPSIFWNDENDTPSAPRAIGMPIWYSDESSFLLGSKHDIWKFDPKGVQAPVMVTDGIGEKNNIRFNVHPRLFYRESGNSRVGIPSDMILEPGKPLLFSSFSKTTKQTGIYYKDISKKKGVMTLLAEGPFTYSMAGLSTSYEYPGITKGATLRPRRKLSVPIIVFTKGNFENPDNVYMTKDYFKNDRQLTFLNPQQKDYNWGSVELVHWDTKDGIKAEGLLYKPEDFDPAKKYPMIIYFYEKDSDELYRYMSPSPSRSTVNIPYFVSNGYLVFDPNIYYVDGHPGQCAMNSIMPGVDMLCKNSWVDADNMAIQGQSWGGYQVAYMITQTDRFKAAGAGAPVSNMTSAYGGIRWGSGMVRQMQYESGQSRIGKNLWEGFDLYYENSPLFFVPNVKTPVLIMHNDKDGAVPWYQGIEFFTALRRCKKQAWMLQYVGEDHNLVQRHNAKDLSKKLAEFFDHFLKDAPMPEWMKNN